MTTALSKGGKKTFPDDAALEFGDGLVMDSDNEDISNLYPPEITIAPIAKGDDGTMSITQKEVNRVLPLQTGA